MKAVHNDHSDRNVFICVLECPEVEGHTQARNEMLLVLVYVQRLLTAQEYQLLENSDN
jgi:hypothetical protein